MKQNFENLGFYPADILLPNKDVDMTKWAVVACDQFTSQPEYWQAVEKTVGESPSTLRLILPEAKLGEPDVEEQIRKINVVMEEYLAADLFREWKDSLIYMERTQSDGKVRRGLIGKVDLEQYNFTPGSGTLIRATEETVIARIPPRVRVRKDAPIELPHVMLLIDDPGRTVIEPLCAESDVMELVYDFELQQDGGHLKGWKLTDAQMESVSRALTVLASSEEMERKYDLKGVAPLLFAVGDGNHSLATAKQCYEDLKKVTPPEQWVALPARYALVEVVNNHDDALGFEPIHRVLFDVEPKKVLEALCAWYPGAYEGEGEGHVLRYLYDDCVGSITVPNPAMQLPVGTLQTFLDAYLKEQGGEVDYIHDDDVVEDLGRKPGNMGFLLPVIGKEQLFKTVIADGVMPRKAFSMGHARDKRYYVEARKIR